jgi:hypothetical protein
MMVQGGQICSIHNALVVKGTKTLSDFIPLLAFQSWTLTNLLGWCIEADDGLCNL